MGKSFSVQLEELEKASKNLKDYADTYSRIYKELMQKAGTMGEAWQGDDNLKYVEQITGFAQKLQDMATKLTNASETLLKQKTKYATRQENNISAVSKLKN